MKVTGEVLNIPRIQTYQVGMKVWPYPKKVALAAAVVTTIRMRARDRRHGVDDTPMKSYSPKGPIYVPITGGKTGQTKTSLGGREVVTQKDLRVMRRRAKAGQGPAVKISKTKKTVKFENYREYKLSLGKSGERDLELSGRMLRSIKPVRISAKEIIIGFGREEEMKKARANQKIERWFGFSQRDARQILQDASRICELPLKSVKPT